RGLVPILDATPAGRAVYSAIGFQDTWGFERLVCREFRAAERPEAAPGGTTIREIADADWPELCAFDAESFGADRSAVLGRLRGRAPAVELVAYRHDRIAGFLLGRDGQSATQLGPLLAEDDATALALLERGLGATSGPIYIDLADSRRATHAWL